MDKLNRAGLREYAERVTAMQPREDGCKRFIAIDPATLISLLDSEEKAGSELVRCRKNLQGMIDQTTPLEPIPGDPMWSRRIQIDDVIAQRDAVSAELEARTSPCDWTERQILDFLGVALRNVEIVGSVHLNDIRQGFQYVIEGAIRSRVETESHGTIKQMGRTEGDAP